MATVNLYHFVRQIHTRHCDPTCERGLIDDHLVGSHSFSSNLDTLWQQRGFRLPLAKDRQVRFRPQCSFGMATADCMGLG